MEMTIKLIFHLLTLSHIFLIGVNATDELSLDVKEQKAIAFYRTFFAKETNLNTAITDYFNNDHTDLNLDCHINAYDPDRHEKRFTKTQISDNPAFFWIELTKLTWLCSLNLTAALNGKLPRSINSFLRLTSLDLSHNNLKTLPSSVGELSPQCKINLQINPLLPQGDNETVWGRDELAAHFGPNVRF